MSARTTDTRSSIPAVQSRFGNRQLLAILFVDACESCRAIRNDETAALQSIKHDMNEMRALIFEHDGTLISSRGDGLLVTFTSAEDAVRCGLAVHKREPKSNNSISIMYRVGIHIGDTVSIEDQVLGDNVNVAARIESLAEPGSVLVSRPVYEALRGSSDLDFDFFGKPYLRNIGDDLELFHVVEQSHPIRTHRFDLHLLGSFKLFGPHGKEISVPHEGKALLTALALSPDASCSSQWLRDTIWDMCPIEERIKRYEALLLDLHGAFGRSFDDAIHVGRANIVLITENVYCDVACIKKHGPSSVNPSSDILQGYRIESVAFRRWLLHQRSLLRSALCLRSSEFSVVPSPSLSTRIEIQTPLMFAIGLLPARTQGDNHKARFVTDLLMDWLIRSLSETEVLEIHDYRDGAGAVRSASNAPASVGPDLMIECRAGSVGDMVQIAITALRSEDRKVIWSQSLIAEESEFLNAAGTSVATFVSYATDALLSILASGKHMRDPAAHQAAKTAIGAVHRLLTMTGPGLDRVEADIMSAYEIDPKPVYLAWIAYMSTFHVGERYGIRDAVFDEQTRELARRTLEADQHNSLVLGLVAHVYSYVFREFAFAEDLISRALETNPFRAMTWDTASLLYSYTGRANEAMKAAETARKLGRHSPYRHLFDGACCVAAAVNGRFEQAVGFGESAMAVQPEFKAVLRYLAASYGHLGDSEYGRSIMRKLLLLEPDMSVECLREGGYPVPSKANCRIIESGLSRIGLPLHP